MKRVAHFACVVLLTLAATSCAAEVQPTLHQVAMDDGVNLATDVYLPSRGDGPWPVILVRSTYGRKQGSMRDYLDKGIAVVVQDVRGMGESEGAPYVFRAEGWRADLHDGADTVDWLRAQPWCNGTIGTLGGSALAMTQVLLAPATPYLAAQAIEQGPTDFYHHAQYHGGVLRKHMMENWLNSIGQPHLLAEFKAHPFKDAFWDDYDANARAGDIHAPALFVNGWYDIFAQGTIDGFLARESRGGEGARGNNYLVLTWAPHGRDVSTDYAFNENRFDFKVSDLRRRFMRHHLLGDRDALDGVAKVHYYVMGDDAPGAPGSIWRTADAWPPYPTEETAYYLTAEGTLSTELPTPDAASLAYTFDPADPCPTLGGPNLIPNLPAGPFDQRALRESRADILNFAGPVLTEPLEITGRVRVQLWVSSDAPDTDFTAKLIDVFPDGREINVLDGIRRVKTRLGFETPAPLLSGAGDIVALEIDLWSTAWIFNTGHRIALQISSSNYPRFELNPNTGADFPGDGTEMRAARNAVHVDRTHASALVLPVRRP